MITTGAALAAFSAIAQTQNQPERNAKQQPLYRITIVSRTTKALNYGYLSAPTNINFAGTPLLPEARGQATINPGRGATGITARFSNVPPPTRFGPQYLTYVVWAISPDGRPQNLGELILDSSNKGTLKTSVPLQTFALIVTAEPYYAVTQPSDVVVMENVLAPNTVGKVEEVNATYELLPRKPFTYDPQATQTAGPARKPVSKNEYDSIVALYQAQNAIQIAEAANAERYAPDRLERARQLYNQALAYPPSQTREVVSLSREATQVAEDSRAIAEKRAAAEGAAQQKLTPSTQSQTPAHSQAPAQSQTPAPSQTTAPSQSEGGRQRSASPPPPAENNRAAVAPAPKTSASGGEERENSQPPIAVNSQQFRGYSQETTENRNQLLVALQRYFDTRDTPRGLVVTVREPLASSSSLDGYLQQLVAAIRPYSNLHLEVEANSNSPNDLAATQRQAEAMKTSLIRAGVPSGMIIARGLGNARPLTVNTTPAGRAQNRRVEIIIAGDSIGRLPTWDRTYSIAPGGR